MALAFNEGCIESVDCFRQEPFFTTLVLPVPKHQRPFCFLVSSSVSFSSILKFSLYKYFISLIRVVWIQSAGPLSGWHSASTAWFWPVFMWILSPLQNYHGDSRWLACLGRKLVAGESFPVARVGVICGDEIPENSLWFYFLPAEQRESLVLHEKTEWPFVERTDPLSRLLSPVGKSRKFPVSPLLSSPKWSQQVVLTCAYAYM